MLVSPSDSQPILIAESRGGIVESVHPVSAVLCNGAGTVLWYRGEPSLVTTMRSAAKPLQALPLVTLPNAAQLKLDDRELAICCASHPGCAEHAALAASVLALSGYLPDDLACGMAGDPPSPLKHGCSGNHAAILLAASLLGYPLREYNLPHHPVQQYILQTIKDISRSQSVVTAQDGCGIPTFGLTLHGMATAFAAMAQPGSAGMRLLHCMMANPHLTAATAGVDALVMRTFPGAIAAKTGAAGLLCVALPGASEGFALKSHSGDVRALAPALNRALTDSGRFPIGEPAQVAASSIETYPLRDPTGIVVAQFAEQPASTIFAWPTTD